jgi:hypothetical protein
MIACLYQVLLDVIGLASRRPQAHLLHRDLLLGNTNEYLFRLLLMCRIGSGVGRLEGGTSSELVCKRVVLLGF